MTPGFTGADLANLMNEAALLTARKGRKLITMKELNEAIEREIAGPERKNRIMTEKEKRTIAFHEAGHALVGHVLENSDPVHKISIISRGQALGYTPSLPTEDRFLSSRNSMYDDLAVFLAGRVAEEIFCDDITTGASNDLERATKMARQMVTRYGMTEALGNQVYGEANHEVFLGRDYSATPDYSEATAQRIDEEVSRIMSKAHEVARATLIERKEQMELMSSVLLDRETVDGEALEALLDNRWQDYLEHEDEILAKKAEAEHKQERRGREACCRGRAACFDHHNGCGSTPRHCRLSPRLPWAMYFSGRATVDDLLSRNRRARAGTAATSTTTAGAGRHSKPPVQQPPAQQPSSQQQPRKLIPRMRRTNRTENLCVLVLQQDTMQRGIYQKVEKAHGSGED